MYRPAYDMVSDLQSIMSMYALDVEEEEVSMVNGGCYLTVVENTNEYTNIARDFEMGICPLEIKEFFWKKKEIAKNGLK